MQADFLVDYNYQQKLQTKMQDRKSFFKCTHKSYEQKQDIIDKQIEKDIHFFSHNYEQRALDRAIFKQSIKNNEEKLNSK